MSFKYSSPPNTISNGKGINFKYYTSLQVGEFVDIPTLNGKFDVTYDGTFIPGPKTHALSCKPGCRHGSTVRTWNAKTAYLVGGRGICIPFRAWSSGYQSCEGHSG